MRVVIEESRAGEVATRDPCELRAALHAAFHEAAGEILKGAGLRGAEVDVIAELADRTTRAYADALDRMIAAIVAEVAKGEADRA